MISSANFTSYARDGFGRDMQEKLAEHFAKLTERNVFCMLSNSSTPFIKKLYGRKGYDIHEVPALRNVNSKGDRRGPVKELIIRNY